MTKDPNRHLREALELARRMAKLADDAELQSPDDGCSVLCGVVRDCAYKIRGQAEQEKERHKLRGVWTE